MCVCILIIIKICQIVNVKSQEVRAISDHRFEPLRRLGTGAGPRPLVRLESAQFVCSSFAQINDRRSINRTRGQKKCEIEVSQFVEQCFQTHNEYRLKHKVPPLILSKKVSTNVLDLLNFCGSTLAAPRNWHPLDLLEGGH